MMHMQSISWNMQKIRSGDLITGLLSKHVMAADKEKRSRCEHLKQSDPCIQKLGMGIGHHLSEELDQNVRRSTDW